MSVGRDTEEVAPATEAAEEEEEAPATAADPDGEGKSGILCVAV